MKNIWSKKHERSIFTSINMAEVPILVMKIPSNKLLSGGLLCVILQQITAVIINSFQSSSDHEELVQIHIKFQVA